LRRFFVEMRGISDVIATILFTGLFIVLAISIISYAVSNHTATESTILVRDVLEKERNSVAVRLIADNASNNIVLVFKGLQNKNNVYFFLDNEEGFLSCTALEVVEGGSITSMRVPLSSIKVLWNGEVTEFKYYAKALGLPQSKEVEVCRLSFDSYASTKMSLVQAKPYAVGYASTMLNANNRRWRLTGTVQFKVAYLGNPSGPHMFVGGTPITLSLGDVVRIDVDTTTGKIDLTPQTLPNGQQGAWILTFNANALAVYLNGALLASNQWVTISPVVAVSITDFRSSLAVEIYPEPPGFVRLTYGGQTVIDHWYDSNYIRVEGWTLLNPATGEVKQVVLQLDSNNLHMEGYAHAIYIGQAPAKKIGRLRLYIVSIVNGVPHVVDIYDYRFR
jgi:uncharacterized protein YunC (DUF1805 family)